jgi:hypothetical protein
LGCRRATVSARGTLICMAPWHMARWKQLTYVARVFARPVGVDTRDRARARDWKCDCGCGYNVCIHMAQLEPCPCGRCTIERADRAGGLVGLTQGGAT